MWCSNCQQDVPAIATPDDDKVRCTKCRQEIAPRGSERLQLDFSEPSTPEPVRSDETPGTVPEWAFVERPPIDFNAWRWDEDLFEAERLLRVYGSAPSHHFAQRSPRGSRATGSHASRVHHAAPRPVAPPTRAQRRSPRFAFFAWAALSIGVMAGVFGGVLLGWSVWSGKQQLWTLGLPFALGGQAALLIGLVLQLDGLWQSNGNATLALEDLDEQIDELRQATAMIANSHTVGREGIFSAARHDYA
jgi:hypothetical protein